MVTGSGVLLCILCLAQPKLDAATNSYNNVVSNFAGTYAISPNSSSQVDIWTNNSVINIPSGDLSISPVFGTGALVLDSSFLYSSGGITLSPNQGYAALLISSSTNYIGGADTHPLDVEGHYTGTVSMVNSLMVVTNTAGHSLFVNNFGGMLSMTNSSLILAGGGGYGLYIDYNGGQQGYYPQISNQLIMVNSTLDLDSQGLVIGNAGANAVGTIQNSLITNLQSLAVGYNGTRSLAVISNSTVYSTGSAAYGMTVGGVRDGTLVLDHTSYTGNGFYNWVGYSTGTGTVTLINGSMLS